MVISVRIGFFQGWEVNKEDNLVYFEVKFVKQIVQKNSIDDNGNQFLEVVSVVFDFENDLECW